MVGGQKPLDVNQLTWNVRRIVKNKLPSNVLASVLDDVDLYKIGADSMMCLEIRDELQQDYGHSLGSGLSPTVVYDCGSIKGLTEYIYSLHTGDRVTNGEGRSGMEEMAERFKSMYPSDVYGDKPTATMNGLATIRGLHKSVQEIIVLTGATGTLGIHVFNQLRNSDKVAEIHCLIRGANQHAAEQRLRKALSQKSLSPLEQSKPHVAIHPCKLTEKETLGLKLETYDKLRKTTTLIIHAAWLVNFNLPLNGFEDQLLSLENLLNLSTSSTQPISPSFLFCSSTAAVLGAQTDQTIQETVYADPKVATETGYAKSKWVAERICQEIYKSHYLPMAIARIGQLCGDDETGAWNVTEAWPLMLSSTKATNALPRLQEEKLDWLKVDVAATAIIEIGFDLLSNACQSRQQLESPLPVYHIVNGHRTPTWDDMLGWIKGWNRDIEILPPSEWVDRLENLMENGRSHPARKLLGLWKAAYCDSETSRKSRDDNAFDMTRTLKVATILREVRPIEEVYFAKVWQWVQQEM
ncbi:MAG: hypothetical protein Q9214_002717 [Letrouitia sp. 1 TL-2023]